MKGFYEQMLMSLTDGDWEFLALSARMGLETNHRGLFAAKCESSNKTRSFGFHF